MTTSILQLNWTALSSIDFVEGSYEDVRGAFIETRKELLKGSAQIGFGSTRTKHWSFPSKTLREKVNLVMPIVKPGRDKFLVSEMASGNWCFAIANSVIGINGIYDARLTAERLKTRYLQIVLGLQKGVESIQFVLSDFSKGDSLSPDHLVRIVYVHNEGRWAFYEAGEALPFEDTERYKARKKRDRLTVDMVADYCAHLGIDLSTQENLDGRCELFEYPCHPQRVIVEESLY